MIDDPKAHIELIEESDGSYHLNSKVFDMVKDFAVHLIRTETLGKAFEPEEQYENPDGTPITFDEDYFGNKRGMHIMPGPFATSDVADGKLW